MAARKPEAIARESSSAGCNGGKSVKKDGVVEVEMKHSFSNITETLRVSLIAYPFMTGNYRYFLEQ